MNHWNVYVRWLALAALLDWLLSRTITRAAIFMPKSSVMLAVFQVMTVVGQLATTLAALLALGAMGWLAWQSILVRRQRALPQLPSVVLAFVLLGLVALSLVFLVLPPAGWPSVGYHVVYLTAIASIGWVTWRRMQSTHAAAWLVVAAALALGELYQLAAALSIAWHWSEPSAVIPWLFNGGEACVAGGAFALWWAYGRGGSRRVWIAPVCLAIAFAAGYFVNGEMSGVLAIWSMGLTLYLPLPLYAAALCLTSVTFLVSMRSDRRAAWAILLLAAGGYAPQLSSQAFFDLVGLALLSAPLMQTTGALPSVFQTAGEDSSTAPDRKRPSLGLSTSAVVKLTWRGQ